MATSTMSNLLQHLRRTVLLQDGAGLTDGQLLGCFVEQRDQAALGALVRRHGPMVWGVCRRLLPGHQDAEDAFQATFLVLVRRAAAVVPRDLVANWLYGVARQTALKARATAARRKQRERQVTPLPEPAALPPDQDLRLDLRALLDRALAGLPDRYRLPIVLCDLDGKSIQEAAQHLGWPQGTLAGRLARARALLAKRLARHGLAVAGAALAALLAQQARSACLPAPLVTSTIQAASGFAVGQAATTVVSARVVALIRGVLTAMLLHKLKKVTAVVLLASLIALGATSLTRQTAVADQGPVDKQALAAPAVDLTKMDRPVLKEPAYRSKSPKYCLLVFGPKAETRVWLVLDVVSEPWEASGEKNSLYVDRNGDGDLTDPAKRVSCTLREQQQFASFSPKPFTSYTPHFEIGDIVERGGKVRHADLTLDVPTYVQDYRPCALSVKVNGRDLQRAGGPLLRFADRPQDAPIVHFNGPLTLRVHKQTGVLNVPISYDDAGPKRRRWYEEHPPLYEERQLIRGETAPLYAELGTPGLGRGTFAALSSGTPPQEVHPVAEIEFPTQDSTKPPIRSRVVLKQRCCGTLFQGDVPVPAEAVAGKATVKLSFPDWREETVEPGAGEMAVTNPVKPSPSRKEKE